MLWSIFSKTAYLYLSPRDALFKVKGEEKEVEIPSYDLQKLTEELNQKKVGNVCITLSKHFYFSDFLNVGHLGSEDEIEDIISWRFSKKWGILMRDFELAYLELYEIKEKREKFYFVNGLEKKFIEDLETELSKYKIGIEEIMVPSYVLATALLRKSGEKSFFFSYFGRDDISAGLVVDKKIVFLHEWKNFISDEAQIYEEARSLYFGLMSYLSDRYGILPPVKNYFLGIEGWQKGKFEIENSKTLFIDEYLGKYPIIRGMEEVIC